MVANNGTSNSFVNTPGQARSATRGTPGSRSPTGQEHGAEEALSPLLRMVCSLSGMSMAAIVCKDPQGAWFAGRHGLPNLDFELESFPSVEVFREDAVAIHEDLRRIDHYASQAWCAGFPNLVFHVGIPLVGMDGGLLGVLSLFDSVTREWNPAHRDAIAPLVQAMARILELLDRQNSEAARARKLEKALRTSESFFRTLADTLPHHILRKDRDGRFTFVNSKFCEYLGLSREEVLGRTDFDFFPADLAAKYHADDLKVMADQWPLQAVEKHKAPGHASIDVQIIKTPVVDGDGRVVGVQGIFWDVTEQNTIKADLKRERQLLSSLIENTPDQIFFKDLGSRFIQLSKPVVERLGLKSSADAIGKRESDFLPPEIAAESEADEKRILETGEPIIGKAEKRESSGGKVEWVLTTKMPLKNESGELVGTFGISRDITAFKQVQADLEEARDDALVSAQAKSEFLANMSHEIRTPMNAVIGMTGLLLGTDLNEEQRDFAETIRQSAAALLTIINDILDFSKIEAKKLSLEHSGFNLEETVESVVDIFAERAHSKGLELAYLLDPAIQVRLRGDAGRLRQVLTNIVGNAIKFTERGHVLLRILCSSDSETHTLLKFLVQDTGIGIPPELRPKLFQAFTQADGSMTRRFGGTGLGLAISRQLVELMNGQIDFNSEPGAGSQFWFSIRFEKQKNPPPLPPPPILKGRSILIVADHPVEREVLTTLLSTTQARVHCAGNASAALATMGVAAVAGNPLDCVIIDMDMAGVDGLALAQMIRADSHISSTSMIMLTAVGHRIEPSYLRAIGLAAYVTKPVRRGRLLEALQQTLQPSSPPNDMEAGPLNDSPVPSSEPSALRILVAEDNAVNQKVALRQLKKLGFTAHPASNGAQALQAHMSLPFDVIFMDCQMPEMDGYQATEEIRRQEDANWLAGEPKPPVYIIAMTANALQGDREKCLAVGMNDYISKPVNLSDIESALQRALGKINFSRPSPNARTAGMHSDIHVNLERLKAIREISIPGGPDSFQSIVELFLQQTPEMITRCSRAVEARNAAEARASAHGIKGSSSNLGALRLSEIAAEIEASIEKLDFHSASARLEKLRQEFGDVRLALHAAMIQL